MKTILITGVSRGIGKAEALQFLSEGHTVIGTSIDGTVDFTHERLTVFALDLSKPASIAACVEQIQNAGMHFDILINNAGALFDDEDTHVVVNKLRQTLEVNLIGTIDFTERIIPLINPGSHIVNTSSSAGSLAGATDLRQTHYPYHYPAYKISKVALNMYTRTLANRLTHEGSDIIVSSVHPGWVKTDMGGKEASMTPEEAAKHIYTLALSKPESGQFWFKGEKYPW